MKGKDWLHFVEELAGPASTHQHSNDLLSKLVADCHYSLVNVRHPTRWCAGTRFKVMQEYLGQ